MPRILRSSSHPDVVNDTEAPDEIIAFEIKKLAEAVKALDRGPLLRDVIVTLLQHKTKVCRRDIEIVLNAVTAFESFTIKKPLEKR